MLQVNKLTPVRSDKIQTQIYVAAEPMDFSFIHLHQGAIDWYRTVDLFSYVPCNPQYWLKSE